MTIKKILAVLKKSSNTPETEEGEETSSDAISYTKTFTHPGCSKPKYCFTCDGGKSLQFMLTSLQNLKGLRANELFQHKIKTTVGFELSKQFNAVLSALEVHSETKAFNLLMRPTAGHDDRVTLVEQVEELIAQFSLEQSQLNPDSPIMHIDEAIRQLMMAVRDIVSPPGSPQDIGQ